TSIRRRGPHVPGASGKRTGPVRRPTRRRPPSHLLKRENSNRRAEPVQDKRALPLPIALPRRRPPALGDSAARPRSGNRRLHPNDGSAMSPVASCPTHTIHLLIAVLLALAAIYVHVPATAIIVVPNSNCYTFDNESRLIDFTHLVGKEYEYNEQGLQRSDLVVEFCKDVQKRSQEMSRIFMCGNFHPQGGIWQSLPMSPCSLEPPLSILGRGFGKVGPPANATSSLHTTDVGRLIALLREICHIQSAVHCVIKMRKR
uniref:Uncharacterized protein n=1 Tax=Setaria italica TaxID=4555 RepID=K3XRI8_SETIT